MRRGGLSTFTVGLIALVVVAVGTFFGFTKWNPFASHFEIEAAFNTSNNIKPGSPVRIAGVTVGKVSEVAPTSEGARSAVVTLDLEDAARPIHADATAAIRPRIFLEGNFFVDLEPGSPGAPVLEDGDSIPATQTSAPVQFGQVLKAFKRPTRDAARTTLGELANAYEAGFAEAFNRSLEDQAPAFKFSAIVAEAMLGREPHDLSNFVRDMGVVSAALDRSPPRLKSFLANFNVFARSLAVERDNLEATIAELPDTLSASAPALDALNASFPAVRRFAVEALPGVRSSLPAIRAARPFVAQLRGLVQPDELRGLTAALRRSTPEVVQLSRASIPLLRQARPAASCANEVLIPWGNDTVPDENFPAAGPVHETFVQWLPGIAGESRSFDANGQWFKVLGTGGLETFQLGEGFFGTSLFPIVGVNPPMPQERPPLRGDVPCETQEKPNLETRPGGPPQPLDLDRNSPAAKKRYELSRETAILQMRAELRRAGIDLEVLDQDATRATIDALAKKTGLSAQLDVLRDGLPLNRSNIAKAAGK